MPEAVWSYTESKLAALFTEAHSIWLLQLSFWERKTPIRGSLQESPYIMAVRLPNIIAKRQYAVSASSVGGLLILLSMAANFVTRPFWRTH